MEDKVINMDTKKINVKLADAIKEDIEWGLFGN